MSADIYRHAIDFLAVLLTGCVVKLMDDYLDQEIDIVRGKYSFAHHLGIGTIAYTLILFAISVSLNWQVSVALLFAAYMTGMIYDFKTKYMLGLSGLQEISIVFLLSCLLVGMEHTFTAIFILLFIQVVDDWFDMRNDTITGQRNSMQILGLMEAWICGIIVLLLAFYIDARLSLFVIMAAPLAAWLIKQGENKGMIQ